MAKCVHHIWNTTDTEPCWRCEELKYAERINTLKDMKDTCVMCGKETEYDINESIHNRFNYVEGAGQLCSSCAGKEDESVLIEPLAWGIQGGNANEIMINVPASMIKETPNDMELGGKIRRLLD